MSRSLTWLVAGGILALGLAAILDSVDGFFLGSRGRHTNPFVAASPAPAGSSPERWPTCTGPQLGLAIEVLGGSAAVALRHVGGASCHRRRLPVKLTVHDPEGERVDLVAGEAFGVSPFRGDFSPGFEQLRNVTFLPRCTPETVPDLTYVLTAQAGPYRARKRLSGQEIGCFAGG